MEPKIKSPLRSPSPLIMSQGFQPSPLQPPMDSTNNEAEDTHSHNFSDLNANANPRRTLDLDLDVKDAAPTPIKDSMDVDESAITEDDKYPQQNTLVETTEPKIKSPLRSPSPLIMSQSFQPSPLQPP